MKISEHPLSDISGERAEFFLTKEAYEHLSCHYAMTEAESEQPVGTLFYQWVGCRDDAGLVCFPHSGHWQAQGGPDYICRHQRKLVFHNMGPLIFRELKSCRKGHQIKGTAPVGAISVCYLWDTIAA